METRIKRIESGLIPEIQEEDETLPPSLSLRERMAYHKVPGVSIAVIDDSKIQWAKGYGVRDAKEKNLVTTDTLFQAASVSKSVAAAAALHLVEKGRISLDEDINNKLASWKVPENGLTREEKVTLRRILRHKAGLSVHGFGGYKPGSPLPLLVQILNGEKPANNAPIRVVIEPGRKDQYSGGGFTVMQQLMIDLMQRPFPDIMEKTVLHPLGMTRSTYAQPLPEEFLSSASSGHLANGRPIRGKHNIHPEMAAAGLWTTPTDLGKFAIAVILAWAGESDIVLSKKMARLMLSDHGDNRGLGFRVSDSGKDFLISHSGSNAGFRCILTVYPERGQGAVIMTNGENGVYLYEEILRAIAVEYGWRHFRPKN